MFHTNEMGSIIRASGTIFDSLLYFNSWLGFNHGLKDVNSVISVVDERLPGNTGARQAGGL